MKITPNKVYQNQIYFYTPSNLNPEMFLQDNFEYIGFLRGNSRWNNMNIRLSLNMCHNNQDNLREKIIKNSSNFIYFCIPSNLCLHISLCRSFEYTDLLKENNHWSNRSRCSCLNMYHNCLDNLYKNSSQ